MLVPTFYDYCGKLSEIIYVTLLAQYLAHDDTLNSVIIITNSANYWYKQKPPMSALLLNCFLEKDNLFLKFSLSFNLLLRLSSLNRKKIP